VSCCWYCNPTPRVSCAAGRRRERAGHGLATAEQTARRRPTGCGKNVRTPRGDRSLRPRSRPGQGRASGVGCTALVGGQARTPLGAERLRHAAGVTPGEESCASTALVLLGGGLLCKRNAVLSTRRPIGAYRNPKLPGGGRLSLTRVVVLNRRPSVPHDGGGCDPAAPLFIAIVVALRRRPAAAGDTGYSEPAARCPSRYWRL
jgi:hypothetical protein